MTLGVEDCRHVGGCDGGLERWDGELWGTGGGGQRAREEALNRYKRNGCGKTGAIGTSKASARRGKRYTTEAHCGTSKNMRATSR